MAYTTDSFVSGEATLTDEELSLVSGGTFAGCAEGIAAAAGVGFAEAGILVSAPATFGASFWFGQAAVAATAIGAGIQIGAECFSS